MVIIPSIAMSTISVCTIYTIVSTVVNNPKNSKSIQTIIIVIIATIGITMISLWYCCDTTMVTSATAIVPLLVLSLSVLLGPQIQFCQWRSLNNERPHRKHAILTDHRHMLLELFGKTQVATSCHLCYFPASTSCFHPRRTTTTTTTSARRQPGDQ